MNGERMSLLCGVAPTNVALRLAKPLEPIRGRAEGTARAGGRLGQRDQRSDGMRGRRNASRGQKNVIEDAPCGDMLPEEGPTEKQ
jgi:hypothetical protein